MEELFKQVLLILFAAAVGEATIEFLVAPVIDYFMKRKEGCDTAEEIKLRVIVFNGLSGLLGIGIAFAFSLRLFEMLGAINNFVGVDEVLTGIMIGRGSNFVHGLLKKYFLSITEKIGWIKTQERYGS